MATTPNYSWVMPDPTDFVTDLPADFETFGDAVDASLYALSPGTTAGDLDYYTSSTAKARLAIGTAGQVLQVNGGATAPEWVTPATAGGANWSLLNSGGTSLTGTEVTISGISGADKIMILVSGLSTTATSSSMEVRLNGDTASNYYSYGGQIRHSGALDSMVLEVNQATTRIFLATLGNNASSTASAGITLTGCNSSGVKQFIGSGGSDDGTGSGNSNRTVQGYYNSATVISSISIRASGDTMDAGTVFVYASA
jgi:hypothetical protein